MKQKVRTGAFQLVFFTPELLIENKRWRKVLMSDVYTTRLKAFVADEAHTDSKWYVRSHIAHIVTHVTTLPIVCEIP